MREGEDERDIARTEAAKKRGVEEESEIARRFQSRICLDYEE